MYGYSYGAAKADVWHIAAQRAMMYPQYTLVGARSHANILVLTPLCKGEVIWHQMAALHCKAESDSQVMQLQSRPW